MLPDTGGSKLLGMPLWVWLRAGGVGVAVVVGGIVFGGGLSKRGKQGSSSVAGSPLARRRMSGPRQPVPGMAYPNRPYCRSMAVRVPACAAALGSGLSSGSIASTGGMSVRYLPRYAQPQQQAKIRFRRIRFQPAQPYPQPLPPVQVPQCRRRLWSGTGLFPTTVSATIRWSE